jgi:hypothetical protein
VVYEHGQELKAEGRLAEAEALYRSAIDAGDLAVNVSLAELLARDDDRADDAWTGAMRQAPSTAGTPVAVATRRPSASCAARPNWARSSSSGKTSPGRTETC